MKIYKTNERCRLRHLGLSCAAILSALGSGCASNSEYGYAPVIPLPPIKALGGGEETVSIVSEPQQETIEESKSFYLDNALYLDIARGVASKGALSTEYALSSNAFELKALQRSRFPQITPSSNVNEDGDFIARLFVEQVIFDGGRFRAGKRRITAQQAAAFAEHAIEFNQKVSEAVDAFLREYRATALLSISKDISARYADLRGMAGQRLRGGVGKKSELGLFEVKKFETEIEATRDESDKRTFRNRFETLTGLTISGAPLRFAFDAAVLDQPPSVNLALAEQQLADADLGLEYAERRPEVSLRGSAGVGTSFGLGFDDRARSLSVGVEFSRPLAWGKDFDLEAIRSRKKAARARVDEQKRDINLRLAELTRQAIEFELQLEQAEGLIVAAGKRADEFQKQFLAGAVGIVEAVSVLETYKQVRRQQVEIEYSIFSAELERAQILGLLGPFEEPEPF